MERKNKTAVEILQDANSSLAEKMLAMIFTQRSFLSSLNEVIIKKDKFSPEELEAMRGALKSLLHGDSVIIRYLEGEIFKTYKIN